MTRIMIHVEQPDHFPDRDPGDAVLLREQAFMRTLARLADDISVDLDGWHARLVVTDEQFWLEFVSAGDEPDQLWQDEDPETAGGDDE
jgi:hypothetical protein